MRLIELLDRPIAFHRAFVVLTGSVKGALLLSQAVYWSLRTDDPDGWFYKTGAEWEVETGLTRYEQDGARRDCAKYLASELRGVPATLFWRVEVDALEADLLAGQFVEKPQTRLRKTSKQVRGKARISNKESENTQRLQGKDSETPDGEKQKRPPTDWQLRVQSMNEAIAAVTGDDLAVTATLKRISQISAQLLRAEYNEESVRSFEGQWYVADFRGRQGNRPTKDQVLSELPRLLKSPAKMAGGLNRSLDRSSGPSDGLRDAVRDRRGGQSDA